MTISQGLRGMLSYAVRICWSLHNDCIEKTETRQIRFKGLFSADYALMLLLTSAPAPLADNIITNFIRLCVKAFFMFIFDNIRLIF